MLLTDREIIEKLKIKSSDKILDIGGSMHQHTELKIDTLADIIRPEDAPYFPSKLTAKNFVKVDITKEKLPFANNEFDIVLCTHVLEDLPSPFLVISEMQRVAKKGLIVTPSMGKDMEFGKIDFTNWLTGAMRMPGEAHHKWFFINNGKKLEIIPKIYPVLYTHDFQIVSWMGDKEMVYVWKDEIKYDEFVGLNIHKLIDRYVKFMKLNQEFIKIGRILFFIDNPYQVVKALTKLVLKRGSGYKYRE